MTIILKGYLPERTEFDPKNPHHRKMFRDYLRDYKWEKGCPFLVEKPYIDVVSMCLRKVAIYYLNKDRAF